MANMHSQQYLPVQLLRVKINAIENYKTATRITLQQLAFVQF